MRYNHPRSFAVSTLALFLISSFVMAAEPERTSPVQLTMASLLEMDVMGKKEKVDVDTALNYTWKQKDDQRTLSFDSMKVSMKKEGKVATSTTMSRAKIANTAQDKTTEILFADAPPELQQTLQAFDTPICKLQVDASGKELKRELLAGPGTKEFIDNGMIANTLLFHPPFLSDKDEWTSPTEISMGNGGIAKGDLSYKKIPSEKGVQKVQVSGTISNESYAPPGSPVAIKKAKYIVYGEQTYDPAKREWVSGKLTMDVSFNLNVGENPLGSAKGTMVVSLAEQAAKK